MDDLSSRDFSSLQESIRDLNGTIKELRTEMATVYARKDVMEPALQDMRRTIDSHSDWLMWAQRLVLGAVIMALLGMVVVQAGVLK